MSEKNIIRFAVGSRNDVHSSIWRLWSHNSDLYLAARSYANISKFSFHQSGNYRYAINENIKRKDNQTDRALYKWNRSEEVAPGWVQCLGILVPPRITKIPFNNTFLENKSVAFISPPDLGNKVIFNIIFSPKEATEDSLIRNSAHKIQIIGYVVLQRELAWLVTFQDILTLDEEVKMKDHFNKLKIHLKPGATGDSLNNSFLHILEQGKPPFILDIELGRENLQSPYLRAKP